MLTVRHIVDGGETIQEARGVAAQTTSDNERVLVCDGSLTLRDGVAYVMNDAGRTVAKYELGQPLIGAKAVQDLAAVFPDGKIRGAVR